MLFYLLLLLAPLCYGYFSPAPHQAALTDSDYHVENECEKVPGDNPAYYSREEAANQLFEILEFTVSPNPPIVDHRIFFYLRGDTGTHDLPGLADATLELRVNRVVSDDERKYTIKRKISTFQLFQVRNPDSYSYGGPLVQGVNEIVGDIYLLELGPDHGTVALDIEAVAALPDNRILFAFEGKVECEV